MRNPQERTRSKTKSRRKCARSRRRMRLEKLENRLLLAGDYDDVVLTRDQSDLIAEGLGRFAELGGEIAQQGAFAESFSVITDGDGNDVVLGDVFDVGEIISDALADPVADYLDTATGVRTQDIVAFLQSLPGVESADGGLATSPTNELRFAVSLHSQAQSEIEGLDLGANAAEYGVQALSSVQSELQGLVSVDVTFGIDLDPDKSDEQAFYLRDTEINVAADLHTDIDTVDVSVGFLTVVDADAAMQLDIEVSTSLVDLVDDDSDNVTLSQINGYGDSVFVSDVTVNHMVLPIVIDPIRYFVNPSGPAKIELSGDALGDDAPSATVTDFDELMLFNHINVDDFLAAWDLFSAWLGDFNATSLFSVDVPFAHGIRLADVFDHQTALESRVDHLSDENGNPRFEDTSGFEQLTGSSVSYDEATNLLRLPMEMEFDIDPLIAPLVGIEIDSGLQNFETDALTTIEGSATIAFDWVVDLSDPDTPLANRYSVDDLTLDVRWDQSAPDVTGDARYGIIAVDVGSGLLSGAADYQAQIANPFHTASHTSITELFAGLGTLHTLVPGGLQLSNTVELSLGNLSIRDNLFSIPGNAELTGSVSNWGIAPGSWESTDIGWLEDYHDVSIATVTDSLADGLTTMTGWVAAAGDAVPGLGIQYGDLIDTVEIESLAGFIENAGAGADGVETLQDLAAYVTDNAQDAVEEDSQWEGSTWELAYRFADRQFDAVLDIVGARRDELLDVILQIGELASATAGDLIEGVGEFTGEADPVDAKVNNYLDLGVQFDLNDPAITQPFVLDTSSVSADLYVDTSAQSVSMQGTMGILEVLFDDGDIAIAADSANPNVDAPSNFSLGPAENLGGRYALDDAALTEPESTASGQTQIDFQVTRLPSLVPEADRLTVTTTDLNDFDSTSTLVSSPNFPDIIASVDVADELALVPNAIDTFIDAIAQALDFNVFGISFPIIGDALAGPANFLRDLQQSIHDELAALTQFDSDDVACALEKALGNESCDEGLVEFVLTDPTDIKFTMTLSGEIFETAIDVQTDLGLPALGASVDATVSVEGTYEAILGFGVSLDEGVYLDTTADAMTVGLDVKVEGDAATHDLEGRLGFLQVGMDVIDTDQANVGDPITVFHGVFDVDLIDPDRDGKLTLAEAFDVFSTPALLIDSETTGVTGGTGTVDGDVLEILITGSTTIEWMPSIVTTLEIDWQFDGENLAGGDGTGSDYVPSVRYKDVGLQLGSFLENTVGVFLDQVGFLIDPLIEVADVLDEPIPAISDIIGDLSIMDIAETLRDVYDLLPVDTGFEKQLDRWLFYVDLLDTIRQLRDTTAAGSDSTIYFGNLDFNGFDARLQDQVLDIVSMATPLGEDLIDDLSELDVWSKVDSVSEVQDFVAKLEDTNNQLVSVDAGKIEFPIFDDPYSIFGWLLGIDEAEIITWDLPTVSLDIPISLGLTFFGFLDVGLFGSIQATTDIEVGIDTYGLTKFFETRDPLDFFQGFYVSDRENADGTGSDTPELSIEGEVLAGASIGFDLTELVDLGFLGIDHFGLEGSFGGGISADVSIDILESNGDGKLRGEELRGEGSCLAFEGGIYGEVEASATVGPVHYEHEFVHEELVSLDYDVPCIALTEEGYDLTDTLARLDPASGELRLFVGPDAVDRFVDPFQINEHFEVTLENDMIVVSAFGLTQEFILAQVQSIYANADAGNDAISIAEDIEVDAYLYGGEGNDTLSGGGGNDTIELGEGINIAYGGSGSDTITGGSSRDVIYGGDDRDSIVGAGGDDDLIGEAGADDLYGGSGNDLIDGGDSGDTIYGEDGQDSIYGGGGDDTIDGGPNADYIEGGGGEDTIYGRGGNDVIHGNGEADEIRGNEGDDILFGGEGSDTIKGQLGDDEIDGGEDRDFLYGGAGNDSIDGAAGSDEIFGGVGDDHLVGGDDSDTIYGNEENAAELTDDQTDDDIIFGGASADTIFGDQGDDFIDGGDGGDILLSGGDGDDTISGGQGDDTIDGDAGEDTIDGGDQDDTIDGGSEKDSLRGGYGDDTITGGHGNDEIFGDADDDTIFGEQGNDTIDAGDGDDHASGGEGHDLIFGGIGNDLLEGNQGNDQLRGNEGNDVMYGDDGRDDLAGGSGNDTMRGGKDNDTMRGGEDDDLMLGHEGDDRIEGDGGNDVLRGWLGNDFIDGGQGDDRIDGEQGNDNLVGSSGNDLIFGGTGNDTILGNQGDDFLHGDEGVDLLRGHAGDDFLMAGDGIGNRLDGGPGNDHLVGSDDGSDDPNFSDLVPTGDLMSGGRGDDVIEGLGGADVIDSGSGNDVVWGGNHGDWIISGAGLSPTGDDDDDSVYGGLGDDIIDDAGGNDTLLGNEGSNTINGAVAPPGTAAPRPTLSLSKGPETGGDWQQLSNSATGNGLTQVGGFEEAVFADEDGVYVAWVDWHNGNSEIYLAFHPDGEGDWIEILGSASGGGISGDPDQSRRPTIAKSGDELLVAWTSIDENGDSNIETALQSLNWGRRSTTGQTGNADHAQLVSYNNNSALLGWIDATTGTPEIRIDQYVHDACVNNYLSTSVALYPQALPISDVSEFDMASLQHHAIIAASRRVGDAHDIEIWYSRQANFYDESVLCGGINPPPVDVFAPGTWDQIGDFDEGDDVQPAVELLLADSNGPNEIATQVYVAWHAVTDRDDQIHSYTREFGFFQSRPWELMNPQSHGEGPRDVSTISDTIGYSATPELDANGNGVFVAWMDDSVHQDASGDASIYVMYTDGMSNTFIERREHDASGRGISHTGGALRSLSMDVYTDSDAPYVVWTDASTGRPELYLRHDLNLDSGTPGTSVGPDNGGPPQTGTTQSSRWQNKIDRFDVNDDGQVTPLDALQIINEMALVGYYEFPLDRIPKRFFDTNGDGKLSAIDALQVINEIQRRLIRRIPDQTGNPDRGVDSVGNVLLDPLAVDSVVSSLHERDEPTDMPPHNLF